MGQDRANGWLGGRSACARLVWGKQVSWGAVAAAALVSPRRTVLLLMIRGVTSGPTGTGAALGTCSAAGGPGMRAGTGAGSGSVGGSSGAGVGAPADLLSILSMYMGAIAGAIDPGVGAIAIEYLEQSVAGRPSR